MASSDKADDAAAVADGGEQAPTPAVVVGDRARAPSTVEYDKTQSDDTVTEHKLNHKAPSDKPVVVTGVTGVVKWFNIKRGYGFVCRDDDGTDVFVHGSAIDAPNMRIWLRTLKEDEHVAFNVVQGAKGMEAASVTGPSGRPVRGANYYDIYRATGALPDHWRSRVRTGRPIFLQSGYGGSHFRRPYGPYAHGPPPAVVHGYYRQASYNYADYGQGYGGGGGFYETRPVTIGSGGYMPRAGPGVHPPRRNSYYGRSSRARAAPPAGGMGAFKSRPLHASQERLVRKLRSDLGDNEEATAPAAAEGDAEPNKTGGGGGKRSSRARPKHRRRRGPTADRPDGDKDKPAGDDKHGDKTREGHGQAAGAVDSDAGHQSRPARRRCGSHEETSKSPGQHAKHAHRRHRSNSRSRKATKGKGSPGGGDLSAGGDAQSGGKQIDRAVVAAGNEHKDDDRLKLAEESA